MNINKDSLLQDPYGFCEEYNKNPNLDTELDRLFYKATTKVASFLIYGNIKPSKESILMDVWDFFVPEEKNIMQEANHPFWQAVQELTQQNSDN